MSPSFPLKKRKKKKEFQKGWVPEVALWKMTSWAWASMMRLRVPTVSGEMSVVGSLFSADRTVSLMWPKAPLASCTGGKIINRDNMIKKKNKEKEKLFFTSLEKYYAYFTSCSV